MADAKRPRLHALAPRIPTLGASPRSASGWNLPTRGTRHQRGYGSEWDRLRKVVLKRDCHLCQTCARADRVRPGNIVDHIVPRAEGGSDEMTNLEVICKPCHQIKTQEEANRLRTGKCLAGGICLTFSMTQSRTACRGIDRISLPL
jgi:5-methylcytosine-specific restriction enzyme A